MKKYLVCLLINLLALPTLANESGFNFGAELGIDRLEIDNAFSLRGSAVEADTLSLSTSVGYQWKNHFLIEAGVSVGTGDLFFGTFDDYKNIKLEALIGYSFHLSDRFIIEPKIGKADWELKAKEGIFLNPGPEEERTFEGTDNIWQVNVKFSVSRNVNLNLSHEQHDADYGEFQSTRFGVNIFF